MTALIEQEVAWLDISVGESLCVNPGDGLDHVDAVPEDPVFDEQTCRSASWILGTTATSSHEELAKVTTGNMLTTILKCGEG